jgi:hypothetical protein
MFAAAARGLYEVSADLATRQGILKNSRDVASRCPYLTDIAIAGQLKSLADDYERRAEKASHVDAAKALARSTANAEGEWWT